ncbi:DOMON-like domain-containing protein [Sphingomonas sanxanigenens]|uniref:DOMON-like domain-containing protein n=1 Tax=Sphingomonas sanxanigenens DSM 19645 = NX02 TaxID=1123269 RepID=W0AH86_9SPHN|nr:DOMON-like domain-containing protein [Sphingomonas sanxanigenens]AHE54980.1 hypothetical protein NX02_16505 [Sphingomonas sanxanigenens DSM 19645 = NX02]
MDRFRLYPFPGTAVPDLAIEAELTRRAESALEIAYVVTGPVGSILLPSPEAPQRRDGLWQHTCFEAFFALGSGAYLEANFAPSQRWAAYRFDDYRAGMAPAEAFPAPDIRLEAAPERLVLTVRLAPLPMLAEVGALGLSAVIEDRSGGKSWWALAHPADKPDFHDRDCFVAQLPAAG